VLFDANVLVDYLNAVPDALSELKRDSAKAIRTFPAMTRTFVRRTSCSDPH
jgi:hypothetical protein